MLLKFLRWTGVLNDPGTLHYGGKVMARSFPRQRHLEHLLQLGAQCIINLSQTPHSAETLSSLGIRQLHLPTLDFGTPTQAQLQKGVSEILNSKGLTVVHCDGGYGRTGVLIACVYVNEGMSAVEAIQRIRFERKGSIETRSQESAVQNYKPLG